ncbi:MAG TPA: type II toxin-antitoxin system VapB family antitoxin [Caulobacteraceae bacterium]|nr:type II toxin-antitoxin system VapB family antitoxin [Caulobacteraceae bacterium]
MTRTAKLFANGRSQAVRLPKEFRFAGKEVLIRKDDKTGEVILSAKRPDWDEIFARLDRIPEARTFMEERCDPANFGRDPFADWRE